jgi:hypothetical protein
MKAVGRRYLSVGGSVKEGLPTEFLSPTSKAGNTGTSADRWFFAGLEKYMN